MKKKIILTVVVLLIATFFVFDLQQYLTLTSLKNSLAEFEQWRSSQPVAVGLGFMAVYIIVTALSLPGAAVMTLAAGALFGLLWGTVIVSFASTIGATLAFLVSRFLLRDWVQNRFGKRLKTINRGIEKEGGFYLFTLRLVPIFPFFVINLLMGLTLLKTWTFYWVSQVGMLAGTLVYVNAGTQLAQIDSLAGIMSFKLLASFALLGLFPLVAKKIVNVVQRRRVYQGWSKPKQFDRNLVVIGAGAAGLVSSYIAATVKASVTLVEAHKMGGDCLNYGCVPSKAIIRSAKLAQHMRDAEKYGLEAAESQFSFRKVMARVHNIISQVEPHDSVERYTRLGVEVLEGYAKIIDPWTVEIALNDGGTQTLTTRSIIIATGAQPVVPDLPGINEVGYVTSDTIWEQFAKLDAMPQRLVVLGGGPIGCELSQAFARFGSQVTQIERSDRIMRREDPEVSELAKAVLTDNGVNVLTSHEALRFERNGEQKFIVVNNAAGEQRMEFDALLCAVGRESRLQGYGLEQLGIDSNRTIGSNEFLQTRFPNILTAGDVAGPYQFTHIAAHQAWYASVNALFGHLKKFKADYRVVPWTTFIDPEVARVGINEQEAKEQGIDYEVTRYGIDDLDRAIADSAAHGFIKVLTPPGKDTILGVTIVSEHAAELLAEFVLAMKHGLGLNKILGTIHTYPTWSEANKYTAGEWKRAHAPAKVLALLERYFQWQRG
ncbi:FAD-dependent oxidoreductase [Methylophaga sp. OBS4]|uniref:FAD-dependent oxidoreductase n=1 Tax=Methylophaga sp. OBS4 TaxID=2991935 RepID=UPI0022597BA7|nr:bifunctional TVP38/TMEM64 family protein/FAD-dependent oxidoreductase [Methylophaga sp. OBS4]MCX4186520.1 FAD-dependent oxidoreductase [Methylophaga sp. OBS4]